MHERVSIALLGFVAVLCPAVVIAIYALLIDGRVSRETSPNGGARARPAIFRMKDRLWELNCGILGLLLSSGAAFVITGALKNATGKPRPDLIDRCQPRPGSEDPPVFGLSNSTICSQVNHAILKDGFRSFPSGHSSSKLYCELYNSATTDRGNHIGAWAGLFYLSLYLAGKLHVLDNRGEVWKTFVVLIPALGAALIAISRIMDARHHPFDVLFGSVLGAVVAWCSYRQYFGPLSEPWRKGRAYPIRTWATEPAAPDSAALDREVSRHEGVEPLRAPGRPDEEQYAPTTGGAAAPDGAGRPEANVFRNQISQSQRRRQHEPVPAPYRPAAYATVPETRNPFPPASAPPMPQPRRNDGYWSSSDSDNDDGYELHQQYTISNPQGQSSHHAGFDSRVEDFGRDTAYHPPPAVSVAGHTQTTSELYSGAAGSGVADPIPPVRSPPPQHVGLPGSHEGSRTRGVDLVETYAK